MTRIDNSRCIFHRPQTAGIGDLNPPQRPEDVARVHGTEAAREAARLDQLRQPKSTVSIAKPEPSLYEIACGEFSKDADADPNNAGAQEKGRWQKLTRWVSQLFRDH